MTSRALAVIALAAGCRVGPDYAPPAAPDVKTYAPGSMPTATADADGKRQAFLLGARVRGDWWRLFGSQQLDALVEECLVANNDLAAARASVRRSEDLLRAGYGVFFPQIDAKAGAAEQRVSSLQFGQNAPPKTFSLYTLSGSVGYTLDIWGGERRQIETLRAQVDAQRFTLAGLSVTLSADVVDAAIARGAYRAEIETTRAAIALEKEQQRITEAQAKGGTVPFANVLAIESQIAATEATIPALEQKAEQADHLLAVLAGKPPAEQPAAIALDQLALPTDVPLTLPAQLVRQRPDVLVAEAQLHAENAQIGVATAAMLPNLTLTGTLGANNTALGSLFDSNGMFGSLAGGMVAPIFHGGSLYYQRRAAIDARDQAFASYRQTVLVAFEQVADTLRALEHDADALAAQKQALDTSQHALELIQANYQAGIATYLQVIIANEQFLQARLGYIQASAQRLQDTVALYVALGGGWWERK